MEIREIFVAGAGQMGAGIAQVMAQYGLKVKLFDINQQAIDRGLDGIGRRLDRQVEKKRLTRDQSEAAIASIAGTLNLDDAAAADLVIEAIIEERASKKALFEKLDALCAPQTILATNTSSLPITDLAAATERPDRFIGMHFMNPVPVMKLVEVIRGLLTSDATHDAVFRLAGDLGKTPVTVNDFPGFVSNRLLVPMLNEAAFCVMEGVARPADIDTVMKLGMNHPMGPLELADFIGLDTVLAIMEVLYEGYHDPKYRPCPLVRQMVHAGRLGRKTGHGFYDYNEAGEKG